MSRTLVAACLLAIIVGDALAQDFPTKPIRLICPSVTASTTDLYLRSFAQVLDDPEYDKLLNRLDMVDWYKSSEDYAEWAVDQFEFQRKLIERTIGLGRN